MVDVDLPCGERDDPLYFGILVPAPSGIRYHVQLGGELCLQASVEGAYLPLRRGVLGEFEREAGLRGTGTLSEMTRLSPRDARERWSDQLAGLPDGVFRAPTENEALEFLRRNPDGDHVGEAWLPTAIAGTTTTDVAWRGLLGGLVGRVVVLVWGNSD